MGGWIGWHGMGLSHENGASAEPSAPMMTLHTSNSIPLFHPIPRSIVIGNQSRCAQERAVATILVVVVVRAFPFSVWPMPASTRLHTIATNSILDMLAGPGSSPGALVPWCPGALVPWFAHDYRHCAALATRPGQAATVCCVAARQQASPCLSPATRATLKLAPSRATGIVPSETCETERLRSAVQLCRAVCVDYSHIRSIR
jgi:hypothetical protein